MRKEESQEVTETLVGGDRDPLSPTWTSDWEEGWVSFSPDTGAPHPAVGTQSCVPLLQQLHLHQLVDRGRVLQPLDQGIHEVLAVAREDAQVVPRLVLQLLIPVGVQTHEDG